MSDVRHVKIPLTIFNAKTSTGVSGAIPVEYYQHIMFSFAGNAAANLTVKCQGSFGITVGDSSAPDFSASKTVANQWDYIGIYDYQDGAFIAGDTGIAFTGAGADVRNFIVNIDGLKWISFEVTAYTAGAVTIVLMAASNT